MLDPRDKKNIPDDFMESIGGELSEKHIHGDEEQDMDDLVHKGANSIYNPENEIDPDDAVHHIDRKQNYLPENEIDPDDRVHGY